MRHVRTLLMTLAAVLVTGLAAAQSTSATLAWDMPQNTVADSQAFTYSMKDGANASVAVAAPACAQVSGVTHCSSTIQPLAPGQHSITLTASSPLGTATSVPTTGSTPGKPTNVTITINVTVP